MTLQSIKGKEKRKIVKIGNNLRDLLARQPESLFNNKKTLVIYWGEKYKFNPFTKKDTDKFYKKAMLSIKQLIK